MAPSISPVERIGQAPDQREIGAVQVARGEGGGQRRVRELGLGDHHDAGGVLVQPMHDAGPALAADAGELLAAMRQQGVDQRAVLVAGGGMHDQPGGLVEHDQVGVLVEDGERDRLRLGRGGRGRRQVEDCRWRRAGPARPVR